MKEKQTSTSLLSSAMITEQLSFSKTCYENKETIFRIKVTTYTGVSLGPYSREK